MRKLGVGLAAALILLGGTAARAEVTVAALTGWPPFSGANLDDNGFANEVIATALRRAGRDVAVETMPWPRAKRMVNKGEHDILSSVWHNEAREKRLAFTEPIAHNRLVFITRAGREFTYTGLDSLAGLRVGIAQGFHYGDPFMQADHFTREPAPNLLTNLFAVDTGEVDAAVGDALIARHLINTNDARFEHAFDLSEKPLSTRPLYAGVSRAVDDTSAIVEAMNTGLQALREDGTYAQIKRRHNLLGPAAAAD